MIPNKPQNVTWSDEQWNAIYARGNNILVSAGAGSGKTAVLSERVLQYVLSGKSIDRLIILTFTNASAAEMKGRIREALIKNNISRTQLSLLEVSHIETFDAFSLSLVKKYHYLLNVSRNISIGDSVLIKYHKKRIVDLLVEEYYQNEKFLELLDLYTTKSDKTIKNMILSIYDAVSIMPSFESFYQDYDRLFSLDNIMNNINRYQEIVLHKIDKIKILSGSLLNYYDKTDIYEHIEAFCEVLKPLFEAKSFSEVREQEKISFPSLPRKNSLSDEEKKVLTNKKEEIKKEVRSIQEFCMIPNATYIEQIMSIKDKSIFMMEIVKTFAERFREFKFKNELFEFNDIAYLAIKLFEENESIRQDFKDYYEEILVDEYQDTSDVQEKLISLISNHNVYMVGDIKQSIYRFRNANPAIFKEKYDTFKPYIKGMNINEGLGVRIDLVKNFRSRCEPLSNINLIFEKIMNDKIGGAQYNNGHRLSFGNEAYSKNIYNDYDMEFHFYDFEKGKYSKPYYEAYIIGLDIKKKIENKYMCFDKGKKEGYLASYKDFTILTSNKTNYDIYAQVFEYLGIPLLRHKDDAFFKTDEIYTLSHIIKCVYSLIDNDYYHLYFKPSIVGLLRSFVVRALDDDIYLAVKNNTFLTDFPDVFKSLNRIKEIAYKGTLTQVFNAIIEEFDFYYRAISIGNVSAVENKINYLYSYIQNFSSLGYTIKDLVNYFDIIIDFDIDMEFSLPKSNVDAVNIMTIHKSKGLEFPICYYSDLSVNFNKSEFNDLMLFDKTMGIIMPYYSDTLRDTFYRDIYKFSHNLEDVSEKIRLFYVALTRAKEKMIFVLPKTEIEDDKKELFLFEEMEYKSFYDMILSVMRNDGTIYPFEKKLSSEVDLSNFLPSMRQIGEIKSRGTLISGRVLPLINKSIVGYEEKVTMSSSRVEGFTKSDVRKALDFGTHIHALLEILDFENPDYTIFERNMVDYAKSFIAYIKANYSPIKYYKEMPFVYLENSGIIDLIVEEENKLTIIDYKLKRLDKESYHKQLEIYAKYLGSISTKKVQAVLYSIFDKKIEVVV